MENPEGYVTVLEFEGGEILRGNGRLVVLGSPKSNDETHNCDAMGCGAWHVVHVEFLASAARLAEARALLGEAGNFLTAEYRLCKLNGDYCEYLGGLSSRIAAVLNVQAGSDEPGGEG